MRNRFKEGGTMTTVRRYRKVFPLVSKNHLMSVRDIHNFVLSSGILIIIVTTAS
jgi:hypothetical protein